MVQLNKFKNRFWWEISQYKIRKWKKDSRQSFINGLIIMYHYVSNEQIPDILESCQCNISEFKNSINYIKNQGYSFVSMEEALSIINKKSNLKFAVITFDDIPDCVFTNAYPILKRQNIPFTIYITCNFIDKEEYISKDHLMELNIEPLCTIGAHTMNHTILRVDKNAKAEITASKVCLENLLEKKIKYFAYPFGQMAVISKHNISMVKKAGYISAVSALSAPLTDISTQNLWFLPRIIINSFPDLK